MDLFSDEYFMRQALKEAQKAFDKGEVPIGAVIMSDNRIIARAHNLTEQLNDFTAHAEMQAFTSASNYFGNKYLDECTLFVTLEPCIMCAGAAYWTRIGRVVYGASDKRRGFLMNQTKLLHNKTELTGGILADECSKIIEVFFKQIRN
jgi:tRNA(adenine34) deaminase